MMPPIQTSEPNDEELLRDILQGDERAFTLLYRRRQAGIYRFALQMSGSAAVAEDVLQEVFLALIRGGGGYDARRGSVAAFLYGVARNKVLRCLERQPPPAEEVAPEETACGTPDPLDQLARQETIRAVQDAVLGLPAHYREAVVLCDLHELTYEEAAKALGCAVGTVRSRLHRGRQLLAAKLRPAGQPGHAAGGMVLGRSCL